jgi:hypothetical protein
MGISTIRARIRSNCILGNVNILCTGRTTKEQNYRQKKHKLKNNNSLHYKSSGLNLFIATNDIVRGSNQKLTTFLQQILA